MIVDQTIKAKDPTIYAGFGEEQMRFLLVQIVGSLALIVWSTIMTYLLLFGLGILGAATGKEEIFELRCARWDELIGLDLSEHWYDDDFDYSEEKLRIRLRDLCLGPVLEELFTWKPAGAGKAAIAAGPDHGGG